MIEIPGNNENFDISSSWDTWPDSYLCWINELDSVYTVYLKQLSPVSGDNLIVASDSSIKKNPRFAGGGNGIRIAWQAKEDDRWQVYARNYLQDQFGEPELILDSLENDPQLSLSNNRIAWINDGNLYLRTLGSDPSADMLLDSGNCSSPELLKSDSDLYLEILYVKNISDSLKVCYVKYNEYTDPKYKYTCLSNGPLSDHPKFGTETGIAFQTKINDIWKCAYGWPESIDPVMTENGNCNFQHPALFTYAIPTSSGAATTPYFLAFDTDSIAGNREIFIQPLVYWGEEPAMNLSDSPGDDRKPLVTFLSTNDSQFVSIFWEHEENGKTDIWYAKSPFSDGAGIRDGQGNPAVFHLVQNYPNPFNPRTTIEYVLEEDSHVKITVCNLLGQEVQILANSYKSAGTHRQIFDAAGLFSGVYYCRLTSGDHMQTIAMVLLK
ncbi:MAG: T9SS type A sorting domain-containing protein [Candidatus Marinimicrobia bacterium]|nr:T9SS type A sorting domain-containing protein [Candidatus Neomarinimicrobiota bacterium]